MGHKGAKEHVPNPPPPPDARSKLEEERDEERDEKLESLVNLKEPSFAMIMCFKIEVACIFCKAINIFRL